MRRIAVIFALDSFAGGFVVQSLIAYWFYTRFGLGLDTLGWIFFGVQILSGLSLLLAARAAPRLGLVNTMVFSHLISNVLLIGVALSPVAWLAIAFLLARHLLSQMDVPTRQTFLMLAVRDHEREHAAVDHQYEPDPRPVRESRAHRLCHAGPVADGAVLPRRGPQDRLRPLAVRHHSPCGDVMTLLLTRADVADLLPMDACIEAVEQAFKLHGEGRADPPGILSMHGRDGSFHIKAGILDLARPYFAAKTNTNFPGNPERFGLPTIQGVLLLAEAERGAPLALMDSAEITAIRTGAATAVAARHLARRDAAIVTVCGCGRQGRLQLRA